MTNPTYNCGRRRERRGDTVTFRSPSTPIDDDGRPERVRRGFTVFQAAMILLAGINLGVWFTVGWNWLRTPTRTVAPASEPIAPRLAPSNTETPHGPTQGERWEL